MIPQKQLSLADIFEDCKDIYESDKPQFPTLLENHIVYYDAGTGKYYIIENGK